MFRRKPRLCRRRYRRRWNEDDQGRSNKCRDGHRYPCVTCCHSISARMISIEIHKRSLDDAFDSLPLQLSICQSFEYRTCICVPRTYCTWCLSISKGLIPYIVDDTPHCTYIIKPPISSLGAYSLNLPLVGVLLERGLIGTVVQYFHMYVPLGVLLEGGSYSRGGLNRGFTLCKECAFQIQSNPGKPYSSLGIYDCSLSGDWLTQKHQFQPTGETYRKSKLRPEAHSTQERLQYLHTTYFCSRD